MRSTTSSPDAPPALNDENVASERVRQRLDRLLKVSGLELSVNPIIGAKVQGQYKEVGWALSVKGKIKQLLDFLYLLDQEPYLHRVDKLLLTPRHRSGRMEMKLRYLTLVPAEQKGRQLPPGEVAQSANPEKLDTQQRKLYDVIAMRDPFRPYVKYVAPPPPRKPKPRPKPKPRQSKPRTPRKPRPKPDPIKVVSLTTWAGQQEVHLRNLKTGKIQILKPGEAFPGGKIVMIDYRPLPLAGKPETISSSRLIFRKGNAYWAVELGQELTKERRIPTPQLPEELRSK